MRKYKFVVDFGDKHGETVYALCAADAVILACALRIGKGYHRSFLSVTDTETGNCFLTTGDGLRVNLQPHRKTA